ncbi:uncharacterized protein TOT_010001061 [Theileria orientalis strain Shintoku]|uniref:SH3 domain-containing protein n=1 Tax=Theileria orientalis strain Shintoku TaxID=869250 RepID=J4CCL6_THEOR|nr:uncharacterized protein TOT_010001061 [Theileria orientalis strain Shintoku]BAM39607.1 uncharacterized protein TOT_010001061 [Theileria orientalis strain Shintoku]|eukprot:XP_009689908.1 uncharacterized protein TOT_010001061 [Theileria orientalis strain Shintoku]
MGLDLLYWNIDSMNVLHKTRNSRKDPRNSSPSFNGLDDDPRPPAIQLDLSDAEELLSSNLQYLEISSSKKSKNILPKRSLAMTSSDSLPNDSNKYSNESYYPCNSSLWNSMINNLNYEKSGWVETNWDFNDWNALGSDLTTNSGTINSLNEEKNSDIFQNNSNNSSNTSSNEYSNLNSSSETSKGTNLNSGNQSFSVSKSLSSEGTKNDSTAETTPETMINSSVQTINLTNLKGCHFPSLLKSIKNVTSFLNNHPPLSDVKEEEVVNSSCSNDKPGKPRKDSKDSISEQDLDFTNITQSNGPPVTVKVFTSWNGDGVNTASVKKSEKVQLVARSGNWIYVRVLSNLNRCGWIPEFTLVESEMLSRKMLSN